MEGNNTLEEHSVNSVGAMLWLDDCFLRYDKTDFFSTLDFHGIILVNLLAAKGMTFGLVQNLIDTASDPAREGFDSGESTYSYTIGDKEATNYFYGLVQCWRDISIKDCTKCLSIAMKGLEDCCSAQQGAQYLLGSCKVSYELYPFFASNAPPPFNTPLPSNTPRPSNSPVHQKNSRRVALILGIVGGIIVTLVGCFFTIRRRVASAVSTQQVTLVTQDEETRLFKKEHIVFSLESLIEATGNFDNNNKLGEGGFAAVYKGMTKDGQEIAVKKLCARSAQGKREFMNEVELVANIQHRNLVNLLGCFAEGSERLLVYEYLQNKSLDAFLFDPESRRSFDWRKRFSTINGIARGLLYLHEDSKLRIIHRDIKASNILLDEQLNPKIADFGLARLFPDNETQIHSKEIKRFAEHFFFI
ncbi:cysteine-rich receptor-like protein kinase 10 isoform X1 [Cryptomeria japonica]|uniref:cysteine-rich receptor-like protein kinase 10 isoform X1 n=1 Tax=Cryptomeria japonica TaxID=3369 RepID=UPI0025ABEDD8|nr:cysteine-rich receptor-like protein kinase 10 isoform X1 [Cryptomeria japonica]